MSKFINPHGEPTFGLGICARCSKKFPLAELQSDPNFPGLKVCQKDLDDYDPYRLAPRAPDQIVLSFTRPDESVNTNPSGVIDELEQEFIVTEGGNAYFVTKL